MCWCGLYEFQVKESIGFLGLQQQKFRATEICLQTGLQKPEIQVLRGLVPFKDCDEESFVCMSLRSCCFVCSLWCYVAHSCISLIFAIILTGHHSFTSSCVCVCLCMCVSKCPLSIMTIIIQFSKPSSSIQCDSMIYNYIFKNPVLKQECIVRLRLQHVNFMGENLTHNGESRSSNIFFLVITLSVDLVCASAKLLCTFVTCIINSVA